MDDGFEALVRSRYERLRAAAIVLCGNLDDADDLVQTTLAKAFRHWRRVRAADDVDAYLFKMLTLTYRSSARRRWRGEVPSPDPRLSADQQVGPDGEVAERDAVTAALRALSPAHRQVLVLRFMADWSEQRTADALGCTVGTIKSRQSRALAALRIAQPDPERQASQ